MRPVSSVGHRKLNQRDITAAKDYCCQGSEALTPVACLLGAIGASNLVGLAGMLSSSPELREVGVAHSHTGMLFIAMAGMMVAIPRGAKYAAGVASQALLDRKDLKSAYDTVAKKFAGLGAIGIPSMFLGFFAPTISALTLGKFMPATPEMISFLGNSLFGFGVYHMLRAGGVAKFAKALVRGHRKEFPVIDI